VGSFFGVVPAQNPSGPLNRLGHITRDGPSTARRLLTEAAWQGTRHSPRIRAFFERIRSGVPDRKKIALIATDRACPLSKPGCLEPSQSGGCCTQTHFSVRVPRARQRVSAVNAMAEKGRARGLAPLSIPDTTASGVVSRGRGSRIQRGERGATLPLLTADPFLYDDKPVFLIDGSTLSMPEATIAPSRDVSQNTR
jgi:hypothetical protein